MSKIISTLITNFGFAPVSDPTLNRSLMFILKIDGDPTLLDRELIPESSLAIRNSSDYKAVYLKTGPSNQDWVEIANNSGATPGNFAELLQALENPSNSQQLVEVLDKTYRPSWNYTGSPKSIYVSTSGDDINNDGSSASSSFLTIKRALQVIPTLNGKESIATINVGPGEFVLPSVMESNYTDIVGSQSVLDTFTVMSVLQSSNSKGLVLDVQGSGGPYFADELRQVLIKFTSGASSNRYGWIYRSDPTVAGITRIYCSQDGGGGAGIRSVATFDQIDLLSTSTTLVYNTSVATIQDSVQLNISNCRVAASAVTSKLFLLTTDKVEYKNCIFDGSNSFGGNLIALKVGGFGRCLLTNCYYSCSGDNSNAFLSLKNNGFLQISRGTVLDAGINTVPAAQFVEAISGSLLAFRDVVVCRGFSSGPVFKVDGLGIYPVKGLGLTDSIIIEDSNGSLLPLQSGPVFKVNSTGEGLGGWYQLPNLYGQVSSIYSVEAERFAYIVLGQNSMLTSSGGTNFVSATGGLSAGAIASDLTFIKNGTPSVQGFSVKHSQQFIATDLTLGVLTINHNLNSQFVNISIYNNANVLATPLSVTATSPNQVVVDLSNLVITGTWNLSINS